MTKTEVRKRLKAILADDALTDEAEVLKRLKAVTANGVTEWSRVNEISHAVVSEVRSGKRGLRPQVIKALGAERETIVVYRWITS